jgi:DNA-binding LacI/PurR family transcriptional regulator
MKDAARAPRAKAGPLSKHRTIERDLLHSIKTGALPPGAELPSLNRTVARYGVSRDTAAKAYEALRQCGVIRAEHGRGFFVADPRGGDVLRVVVLLDEVSMYKEELYRSIESGLDSMAQVDLAVHGGSFENLAILYQGVRSRADVCVIVPSLAREREKDYFADCDPREVIFLDRAVPGSRLSSVHQDFERGVAEALGQATPLLEKYESLVLVAPKPDNHILASIRTGVRRLARELELRFEHASTASLESGKAYLIIGDHELVSAVKQARARGLRLARDVGLVSYNDTPLKEIIEGGISVISSDFALMGQSVARLLREGRRENVIVPTRFVQRSSL